MHERPMFPFREAVAAVTAANLRVGSKAAGICLLLAATCITSVFAAEEKDERDVSHKLPEDPKAVVISWGFRVPPLPDEPRLAPAEPVWLVICADGTARLDNPFLRRTTWKGPAPPPPPVDAKVPREKLQELLRFVLDDKNFFELDNAALAKACREVFGAAIGTKREHVPRTVIKVHADGKQHEIELFWTDGPGASIPARDVLASYDDLPQAVRRFYEIEQRLNRARGEILAGGEAGIARRLKLVNACLEVRYPGTPPLTAEHLVDGSLEGHIYFEHHVAGERIGPGAVVGGESVRAEICIRRLKNDRSQFQEEFIIKVRKN